MTTQLNTRVAKTIKQKVSKDRFRTGKTNDIIVEVALENFFTAYSPAQREQFYRSHSRAPYAGLRKSGGAK